MAWKKKHGHPTSFQCDFYSLETSWMSIFPCLWKTEDQCAQAMKKVAKEAFEKNLHHYEIVKKI